MNDREIDQYINAVTRDMGRRQREEVKRELRSHIYDSSEALAAERKVPVDSSIIREVIARMGPPGEIAAEYPAPKKSILTDRVIVVGVAMVVIFAILLVAAGACGLIWMFTPLDQREDKTSHAGAGQIRLDVDTFGDVDIVESTTGDLEVVYAVHARQGHLGEIVTNTTYDMEGDTLMVRSEARQVGPLVSNIVFGGGSPGADLLIKVPKGSHYDVDVKTSYGGITLPALAGGSLSLDSGSGDVALAGGRYDSLNVASSYGNINTKASANDSVYSTGSGNVDLDTPGSADSLSIATSYGRITAKYSAASATFKSGSGDLDLTSTGPADSLTATTSYGGIRAKYDAARATFSSGSGDIDLESAGLADDLSVTTSYGGIRAKYNATTATFSSGSGNVRLDSGQTTGTLDASSNYGNVRVVLPGATLFYVDARTGYGQVTHGTIPLLMTETRDSRLTGYTQGGQGTLEMKLRSGSGDVEISY